VREKYGTDRWTREGRSITVSLPLPSGPRAR